MEDQGPIGEHLPVERAHILWIATEADNVRRRIVQRFHPLLSIQDSLSLRSLCQTFSIQGIRVDPLCLSTRPPEFGNWKYTLRWSDSMVRRDGSNRDLALPDRARNQSDVPKALCTGIRFPPQFQSLAPFLKRGSPQKGFEHMHFATCPI